MIRYKYNHPVPLFCHVLYFGLLGLPHHAMRFYMKP